MKDRDKNNPSHIVSCVRGIGILSEHGKELNKIGDQELKDLIDRLERLYTKDEQYYILSRLTSEINGVLLDRGEDPEDPDEDPENDI